MNTAMEAIDKVRDTSTLMSVAALSKLWEEMQVTWLCGVVSPTVQKISCFQKNTIMMSRKLINNIIEGRKRGKKHHIIINAEGIGHSSSMAKRIEAATGIETVQPFWVICSVVEARHVSTVYMLP